METTGNAMEWLTTALTGVTSLFSTIIDLITENPTLAVLFAAGTFFPLGLKLFGKTKKAAIK